MPPAPTPGRAPVDLSTLNPGLHPAFGPQCLLVLDKLKRHGVTRWRITAPARAVPAAAAGAPPPMTSALELTIWPEGQFTIAAMVLCGAHLAAPPALVPSLTRLLRAAVQAAPPAVELPGGRRIEPSRADLAALLDLADELDGSTLAPTAELLEGALQAPPWAAAAAAPPGAPATATPAPPLEDYLLIPSAGHYSALQQALALNTFEPTEGARFPRAALSKGGARGFAELRPITPEQEYVMDPEEVTALARRMWEKREELSDLDADVLDAISAAWLHHGPRSASDRVPVYIHDLLAMRGLKPKLDGHGRRSGYEIEQRADLWRCLLHLQDIWLDMAEAVVIDHDARGRRTPRTRTLQSRAFVLTDRIGQRRLDGTMDVEAILVTPGEAFGRFLLGPGRQLALLSSRALQYDPLRQKREKRLARYLSWQWRVGAHKGDFQRSYRVRTLLEEIGVKPAELAHKPARTRERLEQALDRLLTDRLVSAWQYEAGWRDEDLKRQGWAALWTEARIVLEAPEIIKTAYRNLDQAAPAPKALPPASSWAAVVKQRRAALGLSQLAAAEQLEISRAYLAQVERGRPPSPALAAKFRRWIGGGSPTPGDPGDPQ
ncbi:MAG TPA: helix-turn-helix transcriptional regulator [Thermoanaerobaculia bacterium]|nr:helix-turn-helix transcriptional regulator [Thermoanaerobaculia bacterium]